MECPNCGGKSFEFVEQRRYRGEITEVSPGKFAILANSNPDECNVQFLWCEDCDPAHENNLIFHLDSISEEQPATLEITYAN